MLRVRDIMTRDVVTLAPDDTLRRTAEVLSSRQIGGAPVVGDDRVVGVISATDVLDFEVAAHAAATAHPEAHLAANERDALADHTVREVMSRAVVALPSTATVEEAAEYIREAHVHRLLVIDDGRLVGITTRMDIAAAIARHERTAKTYVFPRSSRAL